MVAPANPRFIPIPLETLKIDTSKSFDVFIKRDQDKMVLYSAGGEKFTAEVRDKLIENGIYILYITEGDVIPYNNYLAENLSDYLTNPDTNNEEKSEFAYKTISNIARGVFMKPTAESISSYKTAIKSTLNFVLSEEDAVANLINLTRLDFTTYNHSMNVGIFATGLMKALFSFTELLGRQNGELSETDIELLLALLAHVEGQPGPDFLEQCLSVARLSRDRRVVEAARAAASAVVETMR